MGIYIKGMEMPPNCFECPWRCKVDPDNLLCRISGEYFEETFVGTIKGRHSSCPLIPVPPHGRLIDADAMISEINALPHRSDRSMVGMITNAELFDAYVYDLLKEPTIIPADTAEED